MTILVSKDSLFNIFGVDNFNLLEGAIESMAPSLVEYYLSSFYEHSDNIYFNKREVEDSVSIGDYNIYIDYSENIYLESNNTNNIDEYTQTLW
uniref:hypothetical protein n=1 Tax=Aliarcobacter sp. TaxID=2321116 RepID=UPI004048D315